MLYMSATPIPRTLALTIYGDMDITEIRTKPGGRKEIITKIFKNSELKNVLEKMLNEIKAGHQIYVVAPLIDDEEDMFKIFPFILFSNINFHITSFSKPISIV